MTIKHTPGPWTIGGDGADIFAGGTPPDYRDAIHVADCQPSSPGLLGLSAQQTANARLIAASPDLLDVCQTMLEIMEGHPGTGKSRTFLQAAIAKAEGGQTEATEEKEGNKGP